MRGLARDCLVELLSRRIILLFVAMTLLWALIGPVLVSADMEVEMSGNADLGMVPDIMVHPVVVITNRFLWFLVFLAVLATAGSVPNMLSRGRVEFFLSKPISRSSLLLNRLAGLWMTYGATVVVCGLILYLVLVAFRGPFDAGVFFLVLVSLAGFLVWLSFSVLIGVVSGSAVTSIIGVVLIWAAQYILSLRESIKGLLDSRSAEVIVDGLYLLLPKTGEMYDLAGDLALGRPVASWLPLYSSLIFALAMVLLTLYIVRRKSY